MAPCWKNRRIDSGTCFLALFLAPALVIAALGAMFGGRLAAASPEGESITGFEQTSFIETVPADEGRQLVLSMFLSSPLIEPTLRETIRQIVVSQTFESTGDGHSLARVCIFRQVNPAGTEPIGAKYTVSNVGEAAGQSRFEVQLAPILGKSWMAVESFNDLNVSVTAVP